MDISANARLEKYMLVNNKKMRLGYTTGSCAAAAAKAAAYMLLTGQRLDSVSLAVPKGLELQLSLENIAQSAEQVVCAVRKDGGDDFDVTHGLLIYAAVSFCAKPGVTLCGGVGVGRVTRQGLSCAVGEAAINPVPHKMIITEVERVLHELGSAQGLKVEIFVPGGAQTAQKTFNPRLGIVGGISILGTSGIVEPMSETAIIETMRVEIDMQKAKGNKHLLVFFGNYGEDFTRDELGISVDNAVICSNFVGEMLDYASYCEFESVLLVGHAGKLIKLAMGVMNTHSKYADCRSEPLALYAMLNGADRSVAEKIMHCITTTEAIGILREHNIQHAVFEQITQKIDYYMQNRVYGKLRTGAIIFLNEFGVLGHTKDAGELLEIARKGAFICKE